MPNLSPMHDSDVLEETIVENTVTEPPMYKVWLLNDNYTPMEYVVEMLQDIFNKPQELAIKIMLQVHQGGRGLIAIYPKEIAEDKQKKVVAFARERGVPLAVEVERDDSKKG